MKITRRQLRRLIREMIDPEYMREEVMSFAEETDAEGIDFLLGVIGAQPLAGDDEASIGAAFDIIDMHVHGSYADDIAYIHRELTNAGYFG